MIPLVKKTAFRLTIAICTACLFVLSAAADLQAEERLSLKKAVKEAIEANLELKQAEEEKNAAEAFKNAQRANFFPVFNATYQYTHYDREIRTPDFVLPAPLNITIPGSVTRAQDQFVFVGTATQPIFNGFAIINQYKLAKLGLNAAKINKQIARLNVILNLKKTYFSLLKAEKLTIIAMDAVKALNANLTDAENFYQVGMIPLNDLLNAKVGLANAKQDLVVAENGLALAKSSLNIVLRRPINSEIAIEDKTDYMPLERDITFYLQTAKENLLEFKIADLEVQIAEKEVDLARKDYYPSINVTATYTQLGNEGNLQGGEGISDYRSWNVAAIASWNVWEWGKTYYTDKEKRHRLEVAKYNRDEITDQINLRIKEAYLKAKESEINITTVESAIEQAKENLRINLERYKEQMSTSTDVLDAQTLLSETMTNYYSALYDFQIAKAELEKAISLEVLD
jgi:outer membrane protein TolC